MKTKRAKMCPQYKDTHFSCMSIQQGIITKKDGGCPKNTNSRCEIIAPKKRVKKLFNMGTGEELVRVRGWVTHIPKVGAENQIITISKTAGRAGWIPVTLLINKKDTEGK